MRKETGPFARHGDLLPRLVLTLVVAASAANATTFAAMAQAKRPDQEIGPLADRAAQGDSSAGLALGNWCSNHGHALAAVHWWRWAAEKGNAEAAEYAGTAFAEGRGVPRNYRAARALLRQALASGRREAVSALVEIAVTKKGGPPDAATELPLVRQAVGARPSLAVGEMLEALGQDEEAYRTFAAIEDDTSATVLAAWMEAEGRGTARDAKRASERIRGLEVQDGRDGDGLAADAAYRLGIRLETGDGLPADAGRALTLYEIAGTPDATFREAALLERQGHTTTALAAYASAESLALDGVDRTLGWAERDATFEPMGPMFVPALLGLSSAAEAGSMRARFAEIWLLGKGPDAVRQPDRARQLLALVPAAADAAFACLRADLATVAAKSPGEREAVLPLHRLAARAWLTQRTRGVAVLPPDAGETAIAGLFVSGDTSSGVLLRPNIDWKTIDLARIGGPAEAELALKAIPENPTESQISPDPIGLVDGLPVGYRQRCRNGAVLFRKYLTCDDPAEALAALRASADQGSSVAQFTLACGHATAADPEAIAALEEAAAVGHLAAMTRLAATLDTLPPDAVAAGQERALEWWDAAFR